MSIEKVLVDAVSSLFSAYLKVEGPRIAAKIAAEQAQKKQQNLLNTIAPGIPKMPAGKPEKLVAIEKLITRLEKLPKQPLNQQDRSLIGLGLSKSFGLKAKALYGRFSACLIAPNPKPEFEFALLAKQTDHKENAEIALQRLQLITHFAELEAKEKSASITPKYQKAKPNPPRKEAVANSPKHHPSKKQENQIPEPQPVPSQKPNPWTAGPARERDASLYSPNPDLTYAKADCPPPKAQNGQWIGGKGSGKFPNPVEVVPRKPKTTIPEIVRTVEQFITAKRPYVRVVNQLEALPPILASKGEVYRIAMGMFTALGPGGKLLFRRICARVEYLELDADGVYASVAKMANIQMDGLQAMRLLDGLVKRAEGVYAFQLESARDAALEEVPAEGVEDSEGGKKETVITEDDDFQVAEPCPASETPLPNTSMEVGSVGLSRKMPVSASVEIAPELLALKGDRKPSVSGCYPLLLFLAQERVSVEAKTSLPIALRLAPTLQECQWRIPGKSFVRGFAKSPDARSNSPPRFTLHTSRPPQPSFLT